MSEKRHRPHKSRSRHSLYQEATNHRDLIKQLQQELRVHYEQPRNLPRRLTSLLRKLKDTRKQSI